MDCHPKAIIRSVEDALKIVRAGMRIAENGCNATSTSKPKPFDDALAKLLNIDPLFRYPLEFNKGVWFRGQGNTSWPLLPSAFRESVGCKPSWTTECEDVEEFKRKYADWPGRIEDIVDWLCLFQHYGGSTRLLDWTQNILVALYFTCEESSPSSGRKMAATDGAVCIVLAYEAAE
jgi:hypothetical protein